MELYVGMDVSLKETSICVVDGSGRIVCEGTVISEPAAIAEFVKARAAGAVRVGLETGPTTTWLWHELRALGVAVICIDARHAKAALSLQINKSDRNDAVGLARIMQAGWYKEVQVKRLGCHEIRAVLNSRALLVKIKRDLGNQIRGLLKNLGLIIGKAGGNVFSRRVEELIAEHPHLQQAVRPLLAVRERVGREIADLDRKLLSLARDDAQSCRLMTVPGVGPMTALAFQAAIDVRTYLFEAAGVLLTRVPHWCALKAWGLRLAKRIGFKKAKVAVARKLAVILHRMWRDKTDFHWSAKEATA
jgi:transposase